MSDHAAEISHDKHHDDHAGPPLYWKLCGVLFVLTFLEWGIFHVDSVRNMTWLFVTLLSVMSIAKFVIVCGWYMHLRYDSKVLTAIFGFGVVLAVLVFAILFFSLWASGQLAFQMAG